MAGNQIPHALRADRVARGVADVGDAVGKAVQGAIAEFERMRLEGDSRQDAEGRTAGKVFGETLVAMQQGRYAARTIKRRLAGREPLPPFHYRDKGSMATISRFSAVGDIGPVRFGGLRFAGFVAWLLWLAVHIFYLVGFKNRVTAVLHWFVSFLGRGRSERVSTQQQAFARQAIRAYGDPFRRASEGGGEVG